MEPFSRMEMLGSNASREPFEDREGLSAAGVKDAASKAGSGVTPAAASRASSSWNSASLWPVDWQRAENSRVSRTVSSP